MDSPETIKVEDFEYVPSSWQGIGYDHAGTVNPRDLINENIARIESLKIKLIEIATLSQRERDILFQELDILRSAFIDVSSSQYRTDSESPRPPEQSYSLKDELVIEGIIGSSPAIQQCLKLIASIAPSSLAVLLEGETGTGKELFARIIHQNSRRSKFVAVNCGAFPSGVIESELFGHVKGAFTGATSDRKGKFEEAHDGTIFLDEIGELEPFAQVKLLRVLEVGEIQRVGSDQTRKVNVRVIAATNRNLENMVRQGKFREDLFYRINMCPLYLPPLRERRDEIPILLEYFLEEACAKQNKPIPKIDPELRHFLHSIYDFSGNIRELKNLAQYMACIGHSERPIMRSDLPLRLRGDAPPPSSDLRDGGEAQSRTTILRKAELNYWVDLLKQHKGNIKTLCDQTK
ncbi:MAG TPA: sigma 54-interacting transcriptional regulator, partial [Planctomycetota bacterium]|nr:sigma 54-interacting transcriptional regulator [Planctomycetota bacterium]